VGLAGLTAALSLAAAPALAWESGLGNFTTRVSPSSVGVGAPFHDTAILTPPVVSEGPAAPVPTGTVTFDVYSPEDPSCEREVPLFSSENPVTTFGTQGAARSDDFRPTEAGAYHVVAYYSGDEYYGSDSTSCGDAGETANVVTPGRSPGVGNVPPPPPPPSPPTPPSEPGASPGTPTPPGATGPPTGAASGAGGAANSMPLIAIASVLDSSSANLSSTIDPHGLPTTVHFEYSWAGAVGGASAAAISYQSRTPEEPVGSDFTDHPITALVKGLLPNSRYHLRAVARNAKGVTLGVDATFTTPKDPPPPPPVLGKKFNVEPVGGAVQMLVGHGKGAHFTPLTEPRQLPVGSVLDTSHGTARLTSATAKLGRVQSGSFSAGIFKVLQNRKQLGLTEVDLVISKRASALCAKAGKAQTAAKRALPKALLTLLRANAKGKFTTRGRFSSATVRGTTWTTADRCDGTLTLVKRGVVVVTDRRLRKNIVLTAGRSYLARAG
jgi:hypothetical protein